MQLRFFGHAAVGLIAHKTPVPGACALIDPFEPGGFGGAMGYGPIDFKPDTLFLTHRHLDHCHTAPWEGSAQVIDASDPAQRRTTAAERWELRTLQVAHDGFDGRLRGGHSQMLCLKVDGLTVVHTGDIGELPAPEALESLTAGEPIDVLLLTCGGYYTLGPLEAHELALRLAARVIVPIHFAHDACALAHLEPVESYLRCVDAFERVPGRTSITLMPEDLPQTSTTLVLEPSC